MPGPHPFGHHKAPQTHWDASRESHLPHAAPEEDSRERGGTWRDPPTGAPSPEKTPQALPFFFTKITVLFAKSDWLVKKTGICLCRPARTCGCSQLHSAPKPAQQGCPLSGPRVNSAEHHALRIYAAARHGKEGRPPSGAPSELVAIASATAEESDVNHTGFTLTRQTEPSVRVLPNIRGAS